MEKKVCILPLINPGDYDAFRRIVHFGLPDTYDEWGNLHMKAIADILAQGGRHKEVKIYPDEFAEYCRPYGDHTNPNLMRDFAIKKAGLQT